MASKCCHIRYTLRKLNYRHERLMDVGKGWRGSRKSSRQRDFYLKKWQVINQLRYEHFFGIPIFESQCFSCICLSSCCSPFPSVWLSIPGCHHVPEKGPQALGGKIFRRCIVSFYAFLKETHYSEALPTVAPLIPPLATVNHLWLSHTFTTRCTACAIPFDRNTTPILPACLPVHPSSPSSGEAGGAGQLHPPTVQGSGPLLWVAQNPGLASTRILLSLQLFCGVFFSTTYLCAP